MVKAGQGLYDASLAYGYNHSKESEFVPVLVDLPA